WDGNAFQAQPLDLAPGSTPAIGWEGSNFTGTAGVNEVPPVNLEPGLPNLVVYLDLNGNGKPDPNEPMTTTDADGKYSFENLAPGTYTVAMEGQSGFQVTRPDTGAYTVTVQSDHVASGLDFGVTAITSAERGPRFMSVPPSHTAVGQTY